MKFWKKALGGALAAAVLLAGCSAGDTSWTYRAEGQQPPAGVYITYLINAMSTADSKLHEAQTEGETHEHGSYKDLLGEVVEGQTVAEFMKAEADRRIKEHIAVEKQFAGMNLTLGEAQAAYAASSAASAWSGNQEMYEESGVAESSLRLTYENQFKRDAIFNATYGEGGSAAVADQELKDVFQRDYAKVDMMIFLKQTGEEADNAAVKTRAEGYLARLQAGEDLYDLIFEQEKEDAGDQAATIEKPEAGSRAMIFTEGDKGYYYSDQLVDSALAATVGAPVLVEDATYFYLLNRVDILANEVDFQSYRSELLHALKDDEFESAVAGWAADISFEENTAALERYTPARLKIELQ